MHDAWIGIRVIVSTNSEKTPTMKTSCVAGAPGTAGSQNVSPLLQGDAEWPGFCIQIPCKFKPTFHLLLAG